MNQPPTDLNAKVDHGKIHERPIDPHDAAEIAAQEQLAKAEAAKAEQLRTQAEAKAARIRDLTIYLGRAKGRLARLVASDCKRSYEQARAGVAALFGRDDLSVAEQASLRSAIAALAEWPALAQVLPGIIEEQKQVVSKFEAELAELQK